MPNPGIENAQARQLWSSQGWLRLWHAVFAGLRHDVTGRASALHSLAMVASRGLADEAMLVEELNREAATLGALAQLINDFPSAITRPGLGVSVADVVGPVPDLLSLASGFGRATVAVADMAGLPAVAVETGSLRGLLLLAVAHTVSGSTSGACEVSASLADGAVDVVIHAADFEPSMAGAWMDDEASAAGVALLQDWGGGFSGEAGRWHLALPTL